MKSLFTLLNDLLSNRERLLDGIAEKQGYNAMFGRLIAIILLLGGFYGLSMGVFNPGWQTFASALKVPLLFLLTVFICFPALFIVNVLLGARMTFVQSLLLILTTIALITVVLASLAPIGVFFVIINSSYSFIQLLHVAFFTVASVSGLWTLNQGLSYLCEKHGIYPRQGLIVTRAWVVIFALVGTQLAWNLRPFIGTESMQFEVFRRQEGNFYTAVVHSFQHWLNPPKAVPTNVPAPPPTTTSSRPDSGQELYGKP